MKTLKRILCALMLVVFTLVNLFVVPVSALSFTDVEDGSNVQEAVTVLNKLGVINGYDDGTFRPDNNVTRAEFTAMLLRTRGMGSVGDTSLANPPFPDVTDPSVSWAIGNIRTAQNLGIINGYKEDNGTYIFKPNNTVLYEEAVKMIVCALGYGEMGAEGAAWYSKYMVSATQLKFLEGAGGAIGVPATRATIAMMLYNCLEVNLAENNEVTTKTILEDDLKLTKQIGYIASNPTISLSSPDAMLNDNEIQIVTGSETETYKVDNVDEYADMLGAQITFYASEDRNAGTKSLVLATVRKSVAVEVDADDIELADTTDSSVAYYATESASKTTKINIAADSIVVYNDQLYGEDTESSTFEIYCDEMGDAAIPTIGSMKFLDRDGDKQYDVIFVDSYDAYIVSSVTSSTYTIVDNNLRKGFKNNENKLVLDITDMGQTVKIVDKEGKELSFSSIKTGSVVCVKNSNPDNGGQMLITAVVCNDTVSGSVKGINSDGTIKVDSKTYNYSQQAPWVNVKVDSEGNEAEVVMNEPEMGNSGKFYLDLNGNIIGYDKTEEVSNQKYGYIMDVRVGRKVMEETIMLDIITTSGKTAYRVYEKTKVDGVAVGDYDGLCEALAPTAAPSSEYPGTVENDEYSQLVKFTTKTYQGSVVVDEIITAEPVAGGEKVVADELRFFTDVTAADDSTYESTNKQLIANGEKINISSALIIKVPEDRTDTDSYKKMSPSDFRDDRDGYYVEFYDVSTTNSAKVALVYSGVTNAGEVKATSPVVFITEIAEDTDSNGEVRYYFKGYSGTSEVDYWGSEESVAVLKTLQPGDIVRLGTDDDGYATIEQKHVIFSVADGYRDEAIDYEYRENDAQVGEYPKTETGSSSSVAYKIIWGSAYQNDETETFFNVAYDVLEDGDETDNYEQMQKSWFKNAKFFEVDASGSTIEINDEIPSSDNESVINGLTYAGEGRPSELFIYMSSRSSVKMVIIVNR